METINGPYLSGYILKLPHTWRWGSVYVKSSEETLMMISGKRFSEEIGKVVG